MSMQHKSFENMPCPIARSLARVGEWWSMLILRDALHGMTRFDQFQKSLGIAPNMLTRPINTPDYALIAGPAAGERTRRRYAAARPLAAEERASPPNRKRRARARTA